MLRRVVQSKRGATAIEYVLTCSLVALMLVPTVGHLAQSSGSVFMRVGAELNGSPYSAISEGVPDSPLHGVGDGSATGGGNPSYPSFSDGGGSGTTIGTDESTSTDADEADQGGSNPEGPGSSSPPTSDGPSDGGSSGPGSSPGRR